jgi:glutamyl-tRNA reductase
MKVQVVGCSHHTSGVEMRERLAFDAKQAAAATEQWRQRFPGSEMVLLSTCNRTELYAASENPDQVPAHESVVEFITSFHGLHVHDVFDALFERTGEDAVRHLFTVAASLDSMVVGEAQILSQVKKSYELAQVCNSAGPITHEAFQAALRVAKRVATETSINEKRVSIPSVAVSDFAAQIFERFDDKQVLVIGAGEMAEETLQYLKGEGATRITVINRRLERAEKLAASLGGDVEPWEMLPAAIIRSDLVISTTAAHEPIMTLDQYVQIEHERHQRPLFILDLAIPRDFDPAIADRLGVYLYSIDDLQQACEYNRSQREAELPGAISIVEEETRRFMADLHHRATGPTIRRLRQGWQRPKEEELRRLLKKLPELDEAGQQEIQQSFDRLINKLLHPPLESLRDESRHGTPHGLLDALKRLFQLRD